MAISGAVSYPSPTLQDTSLDRLPNLSMITSKALYPFTSGKSVIKSLIPKCNTQIYRKALAKVATNQQVTYPCLWYASKLHTQQQSA